MALHHYSFITQAAGQNQVGNGFL